MFSANQEHHLYGDEIFHPTMAFLGGERFQQTDDHTGTEQRKLISHIKTQQLGDVLKLSSTFIS